MAKIKGKWLFNDVVKRHLDWLNEYQIENVFFYSNGERFTDMYWYDIDADDTVYHISYDETLAVAGLYGNLSNWENEAFKTIEFDGEQDVSANFLAWMQENATLQEEEKPTPTADSVKSKLQSLLTASNAKTGKSDTNLTDAVNTLIEGYGQGGNGSDSGNGSCSGNHIIEVDELPEVGEEGKIYQVKNLLDIVYTWSQSDGDYTMQLGMTTFFKFIATSETYLNVSIPDGYEGAVCYLTDIPDIYVNENGVWESVSIMGGAFSNGFKGEVTSVDDAKALGAGYCALIESNLYQYTNGEFKKLVTEGGESGGTSVLGMRKFNSPLSKEFLGVIVAETEEDMRYYGNNQQNPILCDITFDGNLFPDVLLYPIIYKTKTTECLYVWATINGALDALYVKTDDGGMTFDFMSGLEANIKDAGRFTDWLLANTTAVE